MDFEFDKKTELFDRKWVRVTLYFLVPALVFVLVSAGIRVSQYGIDHTVLVFGDRAIRSGAPSAMRISLMADDGRFFTPEKLAVSLECGGKSTRLFDDVLTDGGMVPGLELEVPKLAAGKCDMVLDIHFDEKRRVIRTPVTVRDGAVAETLDIPEDAAGNGAQDPLKIDDNAIAIFSEDRGVPTGIESTLFLRATASDGAPAELSVSLIKEAEGGTAVEGETDKLGLFAFTAAPAALDTRLRVVGAKRPRPSAPPDTAPKDTAPADTDDEIEIATPAVLSPPIVYTGISASVTEPIVSLGTPVKVIVEQVSDGGAVYADLYLDGSLAHAVSGMLKGARAGLVIKPKLPGLYRLQLYTSPMGAGNSTAVRHFYVMDSGETPTAALRTLLAEAEKRDPSDAWTRAVLALPLEQGGFDVQKAAAFVLSRLYRGHRHPETLVSSRKDDDAELKAFKATFQRMIMIAVIALGLGVSCFIALFAFSAHRRQQEMTRMILEEDDAEDNEEFRPEAPSKRGRGGRVLLQGSILFLILLSAFMAVAVLIDTLTWMQ